MFFVKSFLYFWWIGCGHKNNLETFFSKCFISVLFTKSDIPHQKMYNSYQTVKLLLSLKFRRNQISQALGEIRTLTGQWLWQVGVQRFYCKLLSEFLCVKSARPQNVLGLDFPYPMRRYWFCTFVWGVWCPSQG